MFTYFVVISCQTSALQHDLVKSCVMYVTILHQCYNMAIFVPYCNFGNSLTSLAPKNYLCISRGGCQMDI